MTKPEMIEALLRTAGLTKVNVERFYDAFVDLAKKKLAADREFVLPGLGVLVVRTRKAREGRNPHTGEKMHIGRRKVVRFKTYRDLRLLLNPELAEQGSVRGVGDEDASPGAPPANLAGSSEPADSGEAAEADSQAQ